MLQHITPLKPNGSPKFEQIADQIVRLIQDKIAAPGMAVPTIEQMAEHLGVNRNTAAHAYGALKTRGITEFHPGRGTVIAKNVFTKRLMALSLKEIEAEVKDVLERAARRGVDPDVIRALYFRCFDQTFKQRRQRRAAVPAPPSRRRATDTAAKTRKRARS